METTLNHEILDILSQYPLSINQLIYANKLDCYLLYEIQDYPSQQIYASMWDLLEKGFIRIQQHDAKNEETKTLVIKNFDEFLNLEFTRYTEIELTKLGGQEWEKIFQPNWDNYISCLVDFTSYTKPTDFDVLSFNKQLLSEVVAPLNIDIKKYCSIIDFHNYFIYPYYWKDFSNMDCIHFQYQAETLEEKILVEKIVNTCDYKDKFCTKTKQFI